MLKTLGGEIFAWRVIFESCILEVLLVAGSSGTLLQLRDTDVLVGTNSLAVIDDGVPDGVEAPGIDELAEGQDAFAALPTLTLAEPLHPGSDQGPVSALHHAVFGREAHALMPRVVHPVAVITDVIQFAFDSRVQPTAWVVVVAQGPDYLPGPARVVTQHVPENSGPPLAGRTVEGEDVLGGRAEVLTGVPVVYLPVCLRN